MGDKWTRFDDFMMALAAMLLPITIIIQEWGYSAFLIVVLMVGVKLRVTSPWR